MGSFGERLRREREMRGVSLDDIAEATKIGTRSLRALEEENFGVLPGGIFNKGFVRAYAKYLGLNEDELVSDYLQAAGENSPDPRVIAEQSSSRYDRMASSDRQRQASFPLIPVLILLVVAAAGVGGWHLYQERLAERKTRQDADPAQRAHQAATQPSPARSLNSTPSQPFETSGGTPSNGDTALPSSRPVLGESNTPVLPETPAHTDSSPTGALQASTAQETPMKTAASPSGAGGTTAGTGQPFEVTVRPRDKAWVSIKADGKIAVRGIIAPPDVKTLHATEQLVFWTGNAGAVDITFNGQPIPLAGGANEVAVLVFTPKGATPAKPATAPHAQ